jgi:hypothetical protein
VKRLSVSAVMLVAVLGTAAAPAAAPAATAATTPAGTTAAPRASRAGVAGSPAEWRSFDLLVDFTDLPRRYTCNELWYRMHDLLLALGARPYPQIFTFHCGTTPAASSRSPSVHLEFRLPRALPAADARYEQFPAVSTTVRLAPGTLHSFTAGDCELLRQLATLLLPELPVHTVGAGLTCPAGAARHSFALEVQALMPRS